MLMSLSTLSYTFMFSHCGIKKNIFFSYLCAFAGRRNASSDSPSTHLHHRLFPVAILAHSGHPGDGHVEVRQVIITTNIYNAIVISGFSTWHNPLKSWRFES